MNKILKITALTVLVLILPITLWYFTSNRSTQGTYKLVPINDYIEENDDFSELPAELKKENVRKKLIESFEGRNMSSENIEKIVDDILSQDMSKYTDELVDKENSDPVKNWNAE